MSAYRKVWYFGVRMFELRAATRGNRIGIYACRKSLLPLGIPAIELGNGWVSFDVLIDFEPE